MDDGQDSHGQDSSYSIRRDYFWQRRSVSFYLLLSAFGLLIFISVLRGWFFLGLLLAMNIILSLAMRPFKPFSNGIEINMLSAVLAGLAYGSVAGAVFGGVSMIINFIFMKRLSMFSMLALPGYMVAGFLAPSFAGADLVSLGVGMTVFYNLLNSLPILAFFRGNAGKCLVFGVTNVLFNAFVFSTLGKLLLSGMM